MELLLLLLLLLLSDGIIGKANRSVGFITSK